MSETKRERMRRAVTDVLMANDNVRALYSEWDDGHDVGVLVDQIMAAIEATS